MIVFSIPYFLAPRKLAWIVPRNWGRISNFLHRWIVGTKIEIKGIENIPNEGVIVASKHQSLWEVYGFLSIFRDPAFILKRELMWIPLFGWYVAKQRMIPINRERRGAALEKMLDRAREEIANGRQIIIYPEGTRTTPGADPAYKTGIVRLYRELNCPVVPVALNSGLYWPRRQFMRYPGIMRSQILEPIPPGLDDEAFFALLQERIEGACNKLYQKAASDPNPPPMSDQLLAKLKQMS
ncbi:MAG: lysophospholipid acyltransferase family protein [Pseudomonadota bacterium]